MFKSMIMGAAPRWHEVSAPFYGLILKSFHGLDGEDLEAALHGDGLLIKGAGHKYVRRVPAGVDKKGRKQYRYYYRVTGGHGLAHDKELVEGAAFQIEHDGKIGHFHVKSVDGDKITVTHDESGKTQVMTKAQLREALHGHHSDKISAAKAKAKEIHAEAKEFGSKKQQARAAARVEHLERTFEAPKAEAGPKVEQSDNKALVEEADALVNLAHGAFKGRAKASGPLRLAAISIAEAVEVLTANGGASPGLVEMAADRIGDAAPALAKHKATRAAAAALITKLEAAFSLDDASRRAKAKRLDALELDSKKKKAATEHAAQVLKEHPEFEQNPNKEHLTRDFSGDVKPRPTMISVLTPDGPVSSTSSVLGRFALHHELNDRKSLAVTDLISGRRLAAVPEAEWARAVALQRDLHAALPDLSDIARDAKARAAALAVMGKHGAAPKAEAEPKAEPKAEHIGIGSTVEIYPHGRGKFPEGLWTVEQYGSDSSPDDFKARNKETGKLRTFKGRLHYMQLHSDGVTEAEAAAHKEKRVSRAEAAQAAAKEAEAKAREKRRADEIAKIKEEARAAEEKKGSYGREIDMARYKRDLRAGRVK